MRVGGFVTLIDGYHIQFDSSEICTQSAVGTRARDARNVRRRFPDIITTSGYAITHRSVIAVVKVEIDRWFLPARHCSDFEPTLLFVDPTTRRVYVAPLQQTPLGDALRKGQAVAGRNHFDRCDCGRDTNTRSGRCGFVLISPEESLAEVGGTPTAIAGRRNVLRFDRSTDSCYLVIISFSVAVFFCDIRRSI